MIFIFNIRSYRLFSLNLLQEFNTRYFLANPVNEDELLLKRKVLFIFANDTFFNCKEINRYRLEASCRNKDEECYQQKCRGDRDV